MSKMLFWYSSWSTITKLKCQDIILKFVMEPNVKIDSQNAFLTFYMGPNIQKRKSNCFLFIIVADPDIKTWQSEYYFNIRDRAKYLKKS